MTDSLSLAVHAFASLVSMSVSVDETLESSRLVSSYQTYRTFQQSSFSDTPLGIYRLYQIIFHFVIEYLNASVV